MTAKEYLNKIRNYEKRIQRIQDEILRLEAVATNVSPSLTGMPHDPQTNNSRMADAVCKIIDKETELRQELTNLDAIRKEATAIIAMMAQSNYREVLYKRYIESKEWEDIAMDMYFSEVWIYKIHRKALTEFEIALKEYSRV